KRNELGELLAPLVLGSGRGCRCRCPHVSKEIRVARETSYGLDQLGRIIRVSGDGKAVPRADGHDIAFGRSNSNDGLTGGEDAVQLAGDDDALEAALYGDDVGVSGGQNGGNLVAGEKRQEANIGESGSGRLQALSLGTIADKDQGDTVLRKVARGSEQCVPSPVEAEIAGVQKDKRRIAANGLNYLRIEGRGGSLRREISAVANNNNACRIDAY